MGLEDSSSSDVETHSWGLRTSLKFTATIRPPILRGGFQDSRPRASWGKGCTLHETPSAPLASELAEDHRRLPLSVPASRCVGDCADRVDREFNRRRSYRN